MVGVKGDVPFQDNVSNYMVAIFVADNLLSILAKIIPQPDLIDINVDGTTTEWHSSHACAI